MDLAASLRWLFWSLVYIGTFGLAVLCYARVPIPQLRWVALAAVLYLLGVDAWRKTHPKEHR